MGRDAANGQRELVERATRDTQVLDHAKAITVPGGDEHHHHPYSRLNPEQRPCFALQRLSRQLMSLTLAACLGLARCSQPVPAQGPQPSPAMEDTVAVVHTLQSTIAMGQDDEGRAEAGTAATDLINDYMSLLALIGEWPSSFTTMQTAPNSPAGHYKTYANRPSPTLSVNGWTRNWAKLKKPQSAVKDAPAATIPPTLLTEGESA